ncbi:MAG: alpha/beta fold hydrolase [Acetobacteraceae bacterium]|nr:alpha/beta fold hydrolase [Acetobacteraceae bacterium]
MALGGLLSAAAGAGPLTHGAGQAARVTMQAFWAGSPAAPMYVERLEPADGPRQPYPLLLVHGAGQTGASWQTTPDGREGWAPHFVRRGFTTYIVDLPGHGRSGQPADFAAWSGLRYVEALEALLAQTGPALVVTHSMGGRVGWKLADRSPAYVAALFAVTPAPPPNLRPRAAPLADENTPFRQGADDARDYLTNTAAFPHEAFDTFVSTLVPESARAVNEGRNAAGPELYVERRDVFRDIPAAALAAVEDRTDPPAVVALSTDHFGIPLIVADTDWELPGHGHMLMLEHGNEALAARIADWLEQAARQRPPRARSGLRSRARR